MAPQQLHDRDQSTAKVTQQKNSTAIATQQLHGESHTTENTTQPKPQHRTSHSIPTWLKPLNRVYKKKPRIFNRRQQKLRSRDHNPLKATQQKNSKNCTPENTTQQKRCKRNHHIAKTTQNSTQQKLHNREQHTTKLYSGERHTGKATQ